MPTPINPSFFDDILIKRDDPNAWKSYTGRPNLPLRNSNLQPISELPDHNEPINTIIDDKNTPSNIRKITESNLIEHVHSLSDKKKLIYDKNKQN